MTLAQRLQTLRLKHGYSQEALADRLQVARQTVSTWESGQAVPELSSLLALSDLYAVTLDHLVRPAEPCGAPDEHPSADAGLADFLLRAKRATYAGHAPECAPCRPHSHDYAYAEGDWRYLDSWLGGDRFAGEEAVWHADRPVWSMNYMGRVLGEPFSGDFLKAALRHAPAALPCRGPGLYQQGDWAYHCAVDGDLSWFTGTEQIYCRGQLVYECRFHGGCL